MSNHEERTAIGDSICGLIQQARGGSTDARNQLLTQLRTYIALVAQRQKAPELQAKFGHSDLVQESMAMAVQKFDQFEGSCEAELLAWVKAILENEIKQARRSFRSEKRDVFRERPMDDQRNLNTHSTHAPLQIPDRELTPRTFALQNEEEHRIQAALNSLDEEHRQVIELRNWEKLSFRDIGQRMNRSENAANKLWYRALIALRKAMEKIDE